MKRWIIIIALLGGFLLLGTISSHSKPMDAHFIQLPFVLKNTWWHPPIQAKLQLQFTNFPLDQSVPADIYDIDVFDNDASTVAELHAKNRKAICYINVGAWEDWRPDKHIFPAEVLGANYEGWPGERWLDIRRIDLLAPIMRARLDMCKEKGFDGVEPDNINGYQNPTGFPLTATDQIAYNRWLANEAHQRGLAIGLKNDTEQVADLLHDYDFVVTEGCLYEGWCNQAVPFINQGKPVFAVEYTDTVSITKFTNTLCPQAQALGFNAVLKNRNLDGWYRYCP